MRRVVQNAFCMENDARQHPEPILQVTSLYASYGANEWFGERRRHPVLSDVSFALQAGGTLGIIGASGSGKSTLARCISRSLRPDSGSIFLQGSDIARLRGPALRAVRPAVQLIPQDPATALNPRWSAAELIQEPRRINGLPRGSEQMREIMLQVGLTPDFAGWTPSRFSGGQRARLALARALSLIQGGHDSRHPRVLILDETLSALDLLLRAQMTDLLLDLRERFRLSFLVISHDLRTIAPFADELIVLHEGRVVERTTISKALDAPRHPQTVRLVRSMLHAPGKGEHV